MRSYIVGALAVIVCFSGACRSTTGGTSQVAGVTSKPHISDLAQHAGGDAAVTSDREILQNPELLANRNIPLNSLSFDGVRLLDPKERIPQSKISKVFPPTATRPFEAVETDHFEYQIDGSKVVRVLVGDPSVVNRLAIHDPSDIVRLFGSSNRVERRNPGRLEYYHVRDDHVSIAFYPSERYAGDILVAVKPGDFPED